MPGTDALYGALYFDEDSSSGQPKPETSDAFDLGFRYQSGIIQAQLSGWYTRYNNRLASAYDADCDCTVTRNLGRVDKYGVDGSVAVRPVKGLMFYVFGSYLKSEIKDDIQPSATAYAEPAGTRAAVAGGSPPRDRLLNLAVGASAIIAVGTCFGVDPLIDVIRGATSFLTYPF